MSVSLFGHFSDWLSVVSVRAEQQLSQLQIISVSHPLCNGYETEIIWSSVVDCQGLATSGQM